MASKALNPIQYRPDIDGMRAIAVLAVVIYHYFPKFLPGGFIGVDVFFVISGYLITGLLKKEYEAKSTISLTQFYLRRIRRIFPSLALLLGFTAVAGYYVLFPYQLAELGKHLKSAVSFLANFRLYRETGYFDAGAETKPLMQLWSLAVEEQFYIVWPFLFLYCNSINRIKKIASVLVGLSFSYCVYKTFENKSFAYLMPYTRFWEIGVGGLISLFEVGGSRSGFIRNYRLTSLSTFSLFAIFLVSCLLLTTDHAFPGAWALLPALFGIAVIINGKVNSTIHSFFGNRLFVSIGLMSYPLYLWHWTLLVFAKQRFPEMMENPYSLVVPLFLSFALSYLTAKLWEPLFRHEDDWTILGVRLIAPMFIIGCVGFYFYKNLGLPERYPKEVQFLFKIKRGDPPEWRTKQCFLLDGQTFNDFAPDCDEPISQAKQRKILLWGDSHAAHLYPSLKLWADRNNYAVTQFTYSGCPPLLGRDIVNRKECRRVNDNVKQWILRNRPDRVVVSLYWSDYGEVSKQTLPELIDSIKSVSHFTKQVVVVGPAPIWRGHLPDLALHQYRSKGKFPQYSSYNLEHSKFASNDSIKQQVTNSGYLFVDLIHYLCKEHQGCLVLFDANTITSFDYGHLNPGMAEKLQTMY